MRLKKKKEMRRPITLDEISKNIKNERENGGGLTVHRYIKGKSPSKLATKKFQVKKTPKTDELEREKKGDQTKIKIKSKDGRRKKKREREKKKKSLLRFSQSAGPALFCFFFFYFLFFLFFAYIAYSI